MVFWLPAVRHPLSISHDLHHQAILARWSWFRLRLVDFHGLEALPESFTPDEGEISVNDRLEEDHPRYDMVPCEFNYNWRCQTLTFQEGMYTVTVTVNRDDYTSYYWFAVEQASQDSGVKLFISSCEQYLELEEATPHTESWIAACADLA